MTLRSEPSGFIECIRPPLSSRRNNRADRVALDEGFGLIAWSTVMVCPFVSQLRLDPARHSYARHWRGSVRQARVDDGGAAQRLTDGAPLGDLEQPQSLFFGEIAVEMNGAMKVVD